MPRYTVKQGDCIESIAAEFGVAWEKLWNHPENTDLRDARQDPNVLMPGDIVFVEKEMRLAACATDRLHRFERDTCLSTLVLVLKEFDQPRADEPYTLCVEGSIVNGTTDGNGKLETRIPSRARRGRLLLGKPEVQEEYRLDFGHIDPIQEASGIQGRLRNLGFATLDEFQKKQHLDVTGEADDATLARLNSEYGC